jgi:hypothetical protein
MKTIRDSDRHATLRRRMLTILAATVPAAALMGGCYYKREEVPVATRPAGPTTVVVQSGQRVVTYPSGQYILYGEGTVANPYYWVWMPAGTTPAQIPAPPPLPK